MLKLLLNIFLPDVITKDFVKPKKRRSTSKKPKK